jgi:hypothetical protein
MRYRPLAAAITVGALALLTPASWPADAAAVTPPASPPAVRAMPPVPAATAASSVSSATAAMAVPALPDPAVADLTVPRSVAPRRRLVLAAQSVDVLLDGREVNRLARPPGVVDIGWLAGRVPAGWLFAPAAGVIRLGAELSLGRGAVLEVGPDTRRLELVGGGDPGASSGVSAHGGSLRLLNTVVVSVDPATGLPVSARLAGRPWLSVGAGGSVDVRGSRVTGLGDAGSGPRAAGLFLGPGATGSVHGSTFTDDGVGLVAAGTHDVTIDTVTVTGSTSDGVLLRGDTATAVTGLTSTDNGRDGVSLVGGAGRGLGGLRTERNARYGVRAARVSGLVLRGPRSVDDAGGGVALLGCLGCALDDLGVEGGGLGLDVDDGSGPVQVSGGSVQGAAFGVRMGPTARLVTVDGLTVTGATHVGAALCGHEASLRRAAVASSNIGVEVCADADHATIDGSGIQATRTGVWVRGPASTAVALTHSRVVGGRDCGVEIGGPGATLSDVRVGGARVGVRVYGQAVDTVLDRVTVTDGDDGIVATASTRHLTVTSPTLTGLRGTGLRLASTGLSVRGGTVRGAAVGMSLRGSGQVTGLRISGVAHGIRVGDQGRITTAGLDVLAERTGIRVDHGGSLALRSSRVRAARALVGHVERHGPNTVALPPFPWFGFAALAALLLAGALETVHRLRAGRAVTSNAPAHVVNTA